MAEPLDPFAGVVTAADVYAKLVQVEASVQAIGGKVDAAAGALGEMRDGLRDHEVRIRTLEGDRWPHGKLTLIIAAAGVVLAFLALLLKAG